ncbi:MAG TPA: sulfurtransferase [Steroidobacteraceae bacterium]|nr:sulfurtransferase [Steroidobacteraceae bacterium]
MISSQTLIDTAAVAARIGDASCRIVDCRFDLADADAGAAAFARGHIPGAVYAHLDRDLSGPRTPWSGRHPLPEPDQLAATLGALGIDAGTQVVAYDETSGMYAARLWWLLRWLGHQRVAVLDGGLAAWRAARLPLSTEPAVVAPREYHAVPDDDAHVSADALAALLTREACVLLDARAAERFEGRVEPLDPKPGHIPGARNHPYSRNLGPDGRFLDAAALRALLTPLLGSAPPTAVVSMCGSGVSACHTLLALEIAGLHGARLYPGSWSEWCRDPGRPIATGHERR